MAKKQVIANESAAAAAAPARAAKPSTSVPRVRTSKHSKSVSAEPVAGITVQSNPDPHDAIARIAYSYWESRGCQHGSHLEDWLRAEQEYAQQM